METQFNVVFTGELAAGTERADFIQSFSQRFKCDASRAAQVHDAGKPVTLKSAVSRQVAEEFKRVLEAMGMGVRLEPHAAAEPAAASASSPQENNPYEAPRANLQSAEEHGEMSGPQGVPFGHGMGWISRAYRDYFKGNALAWIGASLLFIILNIIIQVIPLLGAILGTLISPIFAAGLMVGARAQDDGEAFRVAYLFRGFKHSPGQLMLIGVFYLVGMIAAMVIIFATVGGSFAMFGLTDDPAATEALMQESPFAIMLPVLVMLLLTIPMMMAYWFAPALVALDGLSALGAMKQSFIGCLKNMLPFTLYGIVAMLLMIVAMIPVGLGLLVFLPVIFISMYTAYRDIFYRQA